MDAFLRVGCFIPQAVEEELPTLLHPFQILGVEVGEPRGRDVFVAVYLPDAEGGRLAGLELLITSLGGEGFAVETVENQDWLAGYREAVQPFAVGEAWWVDPHPENPTAAPDGRQRLVMPPRTAFGSGSHESTRLILCALEAAGVRGARVLDVGTGSGILALASDVLGACLAVGIDIDPVAVRTADEIRDLQEWRSGVHFVIGSASCAAANSFDLLCNMISASFLPLLGEMAAALTATGVLVISGLLVSEIDTVSSELRRRKLEPVASQTLGEWACLSAGRPA